MKNLLSNDTKISFLRIFSGLNPISTALLCNMYVHIYACTNVCMLVCMHACMYVCMYVPYSGFLPRIEKTAN